MDRAAQYSLEEGNGVHIAHYLIFVESIIKDRFGEVGFSLYTSDTLDYRNFNTRSPFLHKILVEFTNENYNTWKDTCMKKPVYAEIDEAVHVAFCGSCVLREVCTSDCDRLDERRYQLFIEGLTVDTDCLKEMFDQFLEKCCGRRLPELHCEYEPSRPSESEETDEEGSTTLTPDAASEGDAVLVEAAWTPEGDPLGF